MKASTSLSMLISLALTVFPTGFGVSKADPIHVGISEIVIEGNGPNFIGKNILRSNKSPDEYYGVDFDCDGFGDAAYGSPNSTINGKFSAGAVNIVYGTASGLKKKGNQQWHLGSLGLSIQGGEFFGFATASADINNDGCSELIVGSPGRDSGSQMAAGAVYILKGSKQGLQKSGFIELLGENTLDYYGWSITGGDFNHDDAYDIAGGAIAHQLGTKIQAGAVYVDYGPLGGNHQRQTWTLNSSKIKGAPHTLDLWGYSLTTGNFNGDSFDDLAIGSPFTKVGTKDDAGFVNIIYGSNAGLGSNGNQQIRFNNPEKADALGWALNTCYCNDDGFEDLLFGAPGRFKNKGIVILVFGSNNGLVTNQGQALIDPEGKDGDLFGNAIATVGTTGRFGIYIGSPNADVQIGSQVQSNAGLITLFGVNTSGVYEYKDRNIGTGLLLPRKADDRFGSSLSVTTNKNSYTTLIIGSPQTDVGGFDSAGAALSYRIDLSDYTKLTKPLTWDRGRLAGSPEKDAQFAIRLGRQVKF